MFKAKVGSLLLVSAALSLLVFAPGRVSARATVTETNEMLPFDFDVFVPCADENAHLTGKLHFMVHTTETSSGHFQLHFTSEPVGAVGEGEVTGTTYHMSGKFSEVRNDVPAGFEDTFVSNQHVIGQGQGVNINAHTTTHFTLNANGVVTAQVENIRFDCE